MQECVICGELSGKIFVREYAMNRFHVRHIFLYVFDPCEAWYSFLLLFNCSFCYTLNIMFQNFFLSQS